jgi:hypothetical protein
MYAERSEEENLRHPEEPNTETIRTMQKVMVQGVVVVVHSSLPSQLLPNHTFRRVANLFDRGVLVYPEVFCSVQDGQFGLRFRRITTAVDQKNRRQEIRVPSAECAISSVRL